MAWRAEGTGGLLINESSHNYYCSAKVLVVGRCLVMASSTLWCASSNTVVSSGAQLCCSQV